MLKLSGFHRVLIVLAAGLIAGIVHLYLPLLVDRVLRTGVFAGVLVLLLWIAQWAFRKLPQLRLGAAPRRAVSKNDAPDRKDQTPVTKPAQKPQAADKKQQDQSKQDQE